VVFFTTGSLLANKTEASHRYSNNRKMAARKLPQRLIGAGFAYQNLGILRYSRRHVIGDL